MIHDRINAVAVVVVAAAAAAVVVEILLVKYACVQVLCISDAAATAFVAGRTTFGAAGCRRRSMKHSLRSMSACPAAVNFKKIASFKKLRMVGIIRRN